MNLYPAIKRVMTTNTHGQNVDLIMQLSALIIETAEFENNRVFECNAHRPHEFGEIKLWSLNAFRTTYTYKYMVHLDQYSIAVESVKLTGPSKAYYADCAMKYCDTLNQVIADSEGSKRTMASLSEEAITAVNATAAASTSQVSMTSTGSPASAFPPGYIQLYTGNTDMRVLAARQMQHKMTTMTTTASRPDVPVEVSMRRKRKAPTPAIREITIPIRDDGVEESSVVLVDAGTKENAERILNTPSEVCELWEKNMACKRAAVAK